MMGLEPTTFCMASRRSSQLSYIRTPIEYSRGFRRPRQSALAAAPTGKAGTGLVLHAVLTAHLLDQQLGIGDDLHLVDLELERLLEARDQRAVLGDIVRRGADRLAVSRQHG